MRSLQTGSNPPDCFLSTKSVALPHFWWSSKPPMKHNVLGVPRLSIFCAAPIAKWQQAAGLPKNAFTSNRIKPPGLLPFHQKCGSPALLVELKAADEAQRLGSAAPFNFL